MHGWPTRNHTRAHGGSIGRSGCNLTTARRFPPAFPANFSPRYLSLAFVSLGTFTAGAIAAAPVTMVRDDQANKFMPANYSVNP